MDERFCLAIAQSLVINGPNLSALDLEARARHSGDRLRSFLHGVAISADSASL